MQSIVFFISGHSGVLVNARGNVMDQFRRFEEIKDTINEVKYGCLQLIVSGRIHQGDEWFSYDS